MQNCLELLEHKRSNLDSQFLCQIDWFTIFTGNCGKLMELTNSGWRPANLFYTLFVSQKEALRNLRFTKLSPKFENLETKGCVSLMKKLIDGKSWQEYLSCSRTCLNKNSWPQEFFMIPQFHNSSEADKVDFGANFCRLCWHFEKCKQSRDGVMARHGCTGSSFRASRIFIMCWWPS